MTTKSDHDRPIETLLRQTLAEQGRFGAADSHLNAETLAAWADGGLSEDDLTAAEAHAADCSQCQATLAALARTAGLSPAPGPWWSRGWNLGWLVPLAACAAAVAVWVAVPDRQGPASSVQPAVGQATPESTESAKSAVLDKRTAERSATVPAPVARARRAPSQSTAPQTEARREQANAAPSATRDVRQRQAASEEKNETAERLSAADGVGRIATPAAPAVAIPVAPAAAPAAPAAAARASEPSTVGKDRAAVAGVVARADRIAGTRDIVSSDPSIRWRVGRAGLIQRSADGGSTWEVLPTRVTADLLGGMSSSPSICWVVGRSGTVLRAVDGRRFDRVPFPENVDLAAVRATDAQSVVVTTIDGRAFRTADGGTTWTPNR